MRATISRGWCVIYSDGAAVTVVCDTRNGAIAAAVKLLETLTPGFGLPSYNWRQLRAQFGLLVVRVKVVLDE